MLQRGIDYTVKKDNDGWKVYSYGQHCGRFYRNPKGTGYKVVGEPGIWRSKTIAAEVIVREYQLKAYQNREVTQ